MPDLSLELAATADGFGVVCGVDEAGRGSWAGPVVAGAVVLVGEPLSDEIRLGVDDSKKLKPAARYSLFETLRSQARIGIGVAGVKEIDELNILQATLLAMRRAVDDLGVPVPELALVDGNNSPKLPYAVRTVVKGDGRSLSIAAASIAAKVTRDHLMTILDGQYPGYGWAHNAGYGTAKHKSALQDLGVTPAHRKSFAPIRKILSPAL